MFFKAAASSRVRNLGANARQSGREQAILIIIFSKSTDIYDRKKANEKEFV